MLSTREPPWNKKRTQNESKEIDKDISCKWKQKEAEVVILISDKITLKQRLLT